MPRPIIYCCFFALSISLLVFTGCGEPEKISTYNFTELYPSKKKSTSKEDGPDVMLAAIVPEKMERIWTFKATIPKLELEAQRKIFEELVKSVDFENKQPTWTVPKGWKEKKVQKDFVYAILSPLDESNSAKISVSELPRRKTALADILDGNVNRWRGQMGQRRIASIKLVEEMRELKTKSKKAYVFEIAGTFRKPDSMKAAPHDRFGGVPHGSMSPTAEKVDPAKLAAKLPFTYKAPENWRQVLASPEAKLEFLINDGSEGAVVSAQFHSRKTGNGMENTVRKIHVLFGLKPISKDEATEMAKGIKIAGHNGHFWSIESGGNQEPQAATRIAEFQQEDGVWGFLLVGAAPLVKKETAHFKEFLSSIKMKDSKKKTKKNTKKTAGKTAKPKEAKKTAPKADTSKKPIPKKSDPKKSVSEKNTTKEVEPKKSTPKKAESKKAGPSAKKAEPSAKTAKPAVDGQTSNIQLRTNPTILC